MNTCRGRRATSAATLIQVAFGPGPLQLGDERQGAWKLDLWFLDAAGYEKHPKYCDVLRLRLNAETRSAILEIKEVYWRRREYRDTITSDLIYRPVLDHDVRTVHDFERFLDINSMPARLQ